jgi:phosphohistidine phosphatase
MLTLYLIRHAKSSWADPGLDDMYRPLNKRGKSDTLLMAKILLKRNEVPDLVVTSPAKRAFSTTKRIAKAIGLDSEKVVVDDRLYMANETDFFNVIWGVSEGSNSLMIVSHNPGLTDFANVLTGSGILNVPTCGIVRIDFDLKSWQDITGKNGKFMYFEFPKMYKPQDGK